MRLRLSESSIASRFKVSPKIRTDATFDFCNSIGGITEVGFLGLQGCFWTLNGSRGADCDCSIGLSERYRAARPVGPESAVGVAADAAEFAADTDQAAIPELHVEAGRKARRPALQQ
jgi:hypothetical protein